MLIRKQLFALFAALIVVLPSLCHSQQTAQAAAIPHTRPYDLKTVDNPGGGHFVYGTLTGHSTLPSGMTYMLKQVHSHFGEKPQIGKFFQSRDGNTLATFFTVNAKNQGGKPVTGLVIISMRQGPIPLGAALYDFANNFEHSEPSMLQALTAACSQKVGGDSSNGGADQQSSAEHASIPPLHKVTTGDRSAYVNLPDDWHLTGVAGGQLTAEGPHGEQLALGLLFTNIANSPKIKISGNTPRIVCPLKADLFTAFVCVFNQVRQINQKPPATFQLISTLQLPADSPEYGPVRPIQAIFTVDLNDGVGVRRGSARIGAFQLKGSQLWSMSMSASNIPEKYADAENDLLMAIIKSYRQDDSVISKELRVKLPRMVPQDDSAESNAHAPSEMIQQTCDLAWSSNVTQNYILNLRVARDTENDTDGIVTNRFADLLIRSNPNEFEVAPNQQMIQDADY